MTKNQTVDGIRAGAVIALSSAPFGILFGALAIDNGLTPAQAILMSATVYAGASQIVGIELFGQSVPAWLLILSVFAVNFRHILYSAAVTPAIRQFSRLRKALAFFFLTDPQFAEAIKRVEQGGSVTFRWYMAVAAVIYISWLSSSAIGAVFGRLIGDFHALGFDILPALYFLGMIAGFRRRAHFYPVAAVSAGAAILAFHTIGSPWHVSLGAIAGIILAVALHSPPPAETIADGRT